jgi:cytochrome c553
MRLLRLFRTILWSLFGVRRAADSARDLEGARPRAVIAMAVVVGALVVVAIVSLVRFVIVAPARSPREAAPVPSSTAPTVKAPGAVVVRDTMEERVAACTACHTAATERTPDGFSPRIAGKPAGYLFNQLASFRDGRRTYPPMVYLLQNLSDEYLREMAAYVSALELPYAPPERTALGEEQAARARRIVQQGDPERGVPACIECHGKGLAGFDPGIPSLLGLPRLYLTAQFGAWRSGRLRSIAPDCMAEVARRLAPDDAPLLAAWLAAQPVAPGTQREAAPAKLPLQCGSLVAAPRDQQAPDTSSRGGYLVAAGDCVACHTARGGAPFAGGRAIETPFGTVYSTNITPDAATGIGRWTRDEFWRALHEGRSRDGRLLSPAFPYPNFTQVTRADADAMYEYLRTVPAVPQANTPHALRFPYSTQAALAAWRAVFFRAGTFQADEARSAEWNRGAYLVRGLGHCDACHAGRNVLGAVSHNLDLGGGLIPMQNWYAPALAAGSGAPWHADELVALLTSGMSRRGSAMGPMAEVVYRSTQHLSAADARAIATYLQSTSATAKAAREGKSAGARILERGASVYGEHCAQCHGDQGQGAFPAYPALAGNPSVTSPVAANAIKAVLHGGYPPATAPNPRPYGMPPYVGKLSDQDIAAVLSYIRASWGNDAAAVSTLDIERYR